MSQPESPFLFGRSGSAFRSVDDLIAHGIHDESGNGLGPDLCLHILPDSFYCTGAEEDLFGYLFRCFVFGQEPEYANFFFGEFDRAGIELPDLAFCLEFGGCGEIAWSGHAAPLVRAAASIRVRHRTPHRNQGRSR